MEFSLPHLYTIESTESGAAENDDSSKYKSGNRTIEMIVVISIYSLQVIVLIIIALIRFFTYKSVSKYNRRMIYRPSYVSKQSLHVLILLTLLTMLVWYIWFPREGTLGY